MTASMLGLGAVLAASSTAFTALRWLGAAYLVYLGVKLRRAPTTAAAAGDDATGASPAGMFAHAYAVTALNPKGIIFFVVFVPQFLTPNEPFLQQAMILVATFVALDALNATLFALLASAARRHMQRPQVQRVVNRTGGALLVGADALAAGWRKAAAQAATSQRVGGNHARDQSNH